MEPTDQINTKESEGCDADTKRTSAGLDDRLDEIINPDHDGGYGWIIVVCTFFVFSLSSFNIMRYGIFIFEYQSALGWSDSDLGLLGSLRLGLFTIGGKLCLLKTNFSKDTSCIPMIGNIKLQ